MIDLSAFYKSIVESDSAAIVICDTKHTIIYMNDAAKVNYAKYGGGKIVGQSIFDCHNEQSCRMIQKVVSWFAASTEHNKVHTFFSEKQNKDVYMIALRDESGKLIGYYEKHEFRTRDLEPTYKMD